MCRSDNKKHRFPNALHENQPRTHVFQLFTQKTLFPVYIRESTKINYNSSTPCWNKEVYPAYEIQMLHHWIRVRQIMWDLWRASYYLLLRLTPLKPTPTWIFVCRNCSLRRWVKEWREPNRAQKETKKAVNSADSQESGFRLMLEESSGIQLQPPCCV